MAEQVSFCHHLDDEMRDGAESISCKHSTYLLFIFPHDNILPFALDEDNGDKRL